MLLAEDQDAVGELGPGGEDESFGEAVRSRAARRDLHDVDPRAGQDGVERGGELAGAVADEEPDGGGAVVEVHEQVPGLLGGPGPGRMAGRSEDVQRPRVAAAVLAESGVAGLADMTLELFLKFASALGRIAGDQGLAAVDLAEVWFVD
jgi:hypothetical protein